MRMSVTSFVLGLKNEAMIWRISRSNSIIKWQGYRVSASRLAESYFRYKQALCPDVVPFIDGRFNCRDLLRRSVIHYWHAEPTPLAFCLKVLAPLACCFTGQHAGEA